MSGPTFIEKLRALSDKQKLTIIVVVVVIAVLIMGYFWIKSAAGGFSRIEESGGLMNWPKVNMPTLIVPDVDKPDMTDWKTYANEKYGFEVSYPATWFIESTNPGHVYISPASNEDANDFMSAFKGDALQITTQDVDKNASLEEVVQKVYSNNPDFPEKYSGEQIKIGGIDGVRLVSHCEAVGCGAPEWFVKKDNHLYSFNSSLGYQPFFDHIVSTFKFTN